MAAKMLTPEDGQFHAPEAALLAAIADSSDDAIVATTLSGIVARWSPAAERIYGYEAEEMVGRPIDVLVPPHRRGEGLTVLARLFASERGMARLETERLGKDGALVAVALTVATIEDDEGEPLGLAVISRDLTERKALEAQIDHMSRYDPLTGLYSRREFEHVVRRQLPYSRRYGSGGALLMLAVDRLELVTASRGHDARDRVLVHVARMLTDRLRATDTAARFGDRFAVLLPEAFENDARTVAEHLLERVRTRPALLDDEKRWVTCSAGIACFGNHTAPTAEELIDTADLALDEARGWGRDRFVLGERPRSLFANSGGYSGAPEPSPSS
jgi:diguanylate cyclase (GGDEF)-like protein/PAS domain S-box-containing protein